MHISGLLYLHLGSCCCAEASHSSRVQNLHSAGQDPRGGVWTLRGCLMAPFTIHLAFFWRVQVGNSPLFNVDFKYSGHEECESFGWVIAELPLCPAENFSCFHWYIHIYIYIYMVLEWKIMEVRRPDAESCAFKIWNLCWINCSWYFQQKALKIYMWVELCCVTFNLSDVHRNTM